VQLPAWALLLVPEGHMLHCRDSTSAHGKQLSNEAKKKSLDPGNSGGNPNDEPGSFFFILNNPNMFNIL
jgi:hypothetical protein